MAEKNIKLKDGDIILYPQTKIKNILNDDGSKFSESFANYKPATAGTADTAKTLTGLTATVTELNYVDGVTRSIQTQLNEKLNLSGGNINGSITIENGTFVKKQATTSNYGQGIRWWGTKNGDLSGYGPEIGCHNTGGDGTGSIVILPYNTTTDPWGGAVGLYITKSALKFNNTNVSLTGHTHTKSQITDFPTIPTVNNPTITVTQNGTSKGSFKLNQGSPTTIALSDTTYTAGTGLNLSGTAFSVKYGTASGTACQGNDSRLSDARPASDVPSWAKQPNKPSYTASEISGFKTINGETITGSGNISISSGATKIWEGSSMNASFTPKSGRCYAINVTAGINMYVVLIDYSGSYKSVHAMFSPEVSSSAGELSLFSIYANISSSGASLTYGLRFDINVKNNTASSTTVGSSIVKVYEI